VILRITQSSSDTENNTAHPFVCIPTMGLMAYFKLALEVKFSINVQDISISHAEETQYSYDKITFSTYCSEA